MSHKSLPRLAKASLLEAWPKVMASMNSVRSTPFRSSEMTLIWSAVALVRLTISSGLNWKRSVSNIKATYPDQLETNTISLHRRFWTTKLVDILIFLRSLIESFFGILHEYLWLHHRLYRNRVYVYLQRYEFVRISRYNPIHSAISSLKICRRTCKSVAGQILRVNGQSWK